MKQLYFTILLLPLLLAGFQMNAQGYYFYDDRHYEGTFIVETGIKSGILNAFTDIGGKSGPGKQFIKDLNPVFSRPCFGFYSSLMYKERIGIRIQYTSGTITAADSILKSVRQSTGGRYERNLSFRSPIREFALLIEIHPLNFRNDFLREKEPSRFSPYILAGTGIFSFDPQAKLDGNWYSLQPLHTEGQGFANYPESRPYSLKQQNLLAGGGLHYEINAWLSGKLEFIHRFLQTDYLDDVSHDFYIDPVYFDQELPASKARLARQLSDRRAEVDPGHKYNNYYQRGNPGDKDAFFSVEIGLGFLIGRMRR